MGECLSLCTVRSRYYKMKDLGKSGVGGLGGYRQICREKERSSGYGLSYARSRE